MSDELKTALQRVNDYIRMFDLSRGKRADIIDSARGRALRVSDLRLVTEALAPVPKGPLPCGCHCAGNNSSCGGSNNPCFHACDKHVCL